MKQQVNIPPALSELIAFCYQSLTAAREYARGVVSDKDCPSVVGSDLNAIAAGLTGLLDRIDRRIPKTKWEQFKAEVKDSDSLILDNIKSMYVRMSEEQKQTLEMCCEAIYKKEFQIEQI